MKEINWNALGEPVFAACDVCGIERTLRQYTDMNFCYFCYRKELDEERKGERMAQMGGSVKLRFHCPRCGEKERVTVEIEKVWIEAKDYGYPGTLSVNFKDASVVHVCDFGEDMVPETVDVQGESL